MTSAKAACILLVFIGTHSPLQADDWPQWRGPARDGHADQGATLPAVPTTLAPAWRIDIGGGFSSPVIATGKLVYLDARNDQEVIHVADPLSGKDLWTRPFASVYGDEWGSGPRCTPIIDGDRLYVQSCKGEFRCLRLTDGTPLWGTSFEKDFGVHFLGSKANEGTASRRGNNGSGVIDGDRLFLPVGNEAGASLVCFDKSTGKVLWKSQNDEAAYASLMTATLAGVRQVIYFSADALLAVSPADGKLLWRVPLRTEAKRHAATPVIFGDTVIVNSHTIGLQSFKIEKEGDGLKATRAWWNRDLKINISTPVLVDHYLYSQGAGRNYVCVDALTGKTAWSQEGFGDRYSSTIAVGDRLLVVTDRGELVMLAADPAKYTEISRIQICGKTWNHAAYAQGKLYVREGLTSGWKLSCFPLNPPGS